MNSAFMIPYSSENPVLEGSTGELVTWFQPSGLFLLVQLANCVEGMSTLVNPIGTRSIVTGDANW